MSTIYQQIEKGVFKLIEETSIDSLQVGNILKHKRKRYVDHK